MFNISSEKYKLSISNLNQFCRLFLDMCVVLSIRGAVTKLYETSNI